MQKLSEEFRKNFQPEQKEFKKLSKNKPDTSSKLFFENNKFHNCFSNVEQIGEGGQGVVFKAMHKLEGHYYAIKRICLSVRSDEDLRKHPVFREVSTMVGLSHQRVVRYYTCWVEQKQSELNNRKIASTFGDFKKVEEDDDFEISFGNSEQDFS